MSENDNETPADSPHRIVPEDWSALVTGLKADAPAKKKSARARGPKAASSSTAPSEFAAGEGTRSAWEIALELAGRLGQPISDGKHAVWCINDAAHSNPDRSAEAASGSCVLLPPAGDSMFGLPRCSHAHCQNLTLRQWIAGVGYDIWAEAMVQARGWRRAREFLLHDGGIHGWKRIPFLLRDHEDTVDGGPYQVVPDEGDEYCDFTARIVADVEEHEVTTSRHWYEIEAAVSGRARKLRVAAAEFASLSWVSQLGPEAVIAHGRDTAQRLRAGIQYLSKPVPHRNVYAFTGWRQIGGVPVYLHAGGGIGADGALEGVSVSLAGDVLPRFCLPPAPEGKALTAAVRACMRLFRLGVPEVAVPLFGAVWRAPLGASPLTVYLSAPAATGKSMLAALAQQHFGAGMHEGALPASVKHSTAASVNALRAMVGDAVFTLDDFMVSGNAAEDLRLNEKVDSVVRAQYGGTGAQRLSRDGSLATNSAAAPRSTLIITGETLPRGHSLRSRLLVLELPGRIADDLDPMKTEAAAGVYAGVMAAYLRWLAPRLDQVRAEMRELAATTAAKLRAGSADADRDHRTALLLAEVAIGVRYFCQFAIGADASLAAEAETLRQITWATLQTMSAQQLAHRAQQDPVLRLFELVAAQLSAGRCHVTVAEGTAPENPVAWGWRVAGSSGNEEDANEESEQIEAFDDHPVPGAAPTKAAKRIVHRPVGDRLGIVSVKKGKAWIKGEIALRVARELATTLGDPLPLTLEDLPRRLYERGLLLETDLKRSRAYTVRKTEDGELRGGYLCLSIVTLDLGSEEQLAAHAQAVGSAAASNIDK